MKKAFLTLIFVCVAVFVLLGILALFEVVDLFGESSILGKLFLTSLVGMVAGSMFLLPIDTMATRKVLSIVTFLLVCFALVMFLILIWFPQVTQTDNFGKILSVVATLSLSSFVILSYWIRLQKKHVLLQIATYFSILALVVMINWMVFAPTPENFMTFFWMFVILTAAGIIILGALAGKKGSKTNEVAQDKVILSKEEYDGLIARIKELEEKLKQ